MRKTSFILIFLFCINACFSQLPDSLKNHIDTALAIMKDHSYYSTRVNWEKAKRDAYKKAEGATTREQLFKPIADVYLQLNDYHGWFEQYNDKIQLTDSFGIRRLTPSIIKEWGKGPKIKAEMLGDIAYLRIPGMMAFTPKQINFNANWLADSIISLASKNPKAWIIDLRLNTGGNITPMMSGLAVFFEEGILSYYIDRQNKITSTAAIRNRTFYLDDSTTAHLNHPLPDLRKAKVAVIIGAGTASSGEGVAANFKERKNSRLFGEQTSGRANATEGFVFNDNNSYFLITTAALGDKKKKVLPIYINPETQVINNDSFENLLNDNAVKAALSWLSNAGK